MFEYEVLNRFQNRIEHHNYKTCEILYIRVAMRNVCSLSSVGRVLVL